MMKYIGEIPKMEDAILIAHNGKGFDAWIVLQESGIIPSSLIKTPQGIIEMRYKNPFTSKENQEFFKQEFIKRTGNKNVTGGEFLQTVIFRCSLNHVKASLEGMCKSFKLPLNIRKTELDHEGMTLDNFMDRKKEWIPYLILDVLSLACCEIKYSRTTFFI